MMSGAEADGAPAVSGDSGNPDDPASLLQVGQGARERYWLDHQSRRPGDGLMQCRCRFWLIDLTGKDEQGLLRETPLSM